MRKDIAELSQKLESQRIQSMEWWKRSEIYEQELKASEPVLRAWQAARKQMSLDMCQLLDKVEEEMYLLKEAELQATYLQGISDCLDYLEQEGLAKPDLFKQVS